MQKKAKQTKRKKASCHGWLAMKRMPKGIIRLKALFLCLFSTSLSHTHTSTKHPGFNSRLLARVGSPPPHTHHFSATTSTITSATTPKPILSLSIPASHECSIWGPPVGREGEREERRERGRGECSAASHTRCMQVMPSTSTHWGWQPPKPRMTG